MVGILRSGSSDSLTSFGPSAPKGEAPVAKWLEEQLLSERKRIQLDMELRHQSLVTELRSKLKELAPIVEPPLPAMGPTRSEPNFAPPTLEEKEEVSLSTALKSTGNSSSLQLPALDLPGQIIDPEETPASSPVKPPLQTGMSSQSMASDGSRPDSPTSAGPDDSQKGRRNSLNKYKFKGMTMSRTIKADMPAFAIREEEKIDHWLGRFHPTELVRSSWFETSMCILIVLNMVVMAVQVQYHGLETGHTLDFPGYDTEATKLWPGAETAFRATEWVFGVCFFVEIIIRIFGWGLAFPFDFWNWFDAAMVLLWLLSETAFSNLDDSVLRLARTARLLRLVRVIRMIHGFDSLYLMMTAMRGSVAVLFWSFILLLVAQIMIAFLLNEVLSATYLADENAPKEDRQRVFAYFGTCSRAILSMFELTLGNWPEIARLLQDKVSEWYFLFSIAHKVTIGFAVIGVINGVFMQETFKVAGSDDKIMMRQRERERRLHTKKMKVLFEHADESGDGVLDIDEFRQVMKNQSVRTWLAAQDLHMNSPEASDQLFRLLDDGDGALMAQELVEGVARLKGPAKSMDLAVFNLEFRKFKDDVGRLGELAEKLSSNLGLANNRNLRRSMTQNVRASLFH